MTGLPEAFGVVDEQPVVVDMKLDVDGIFIKHSLIQKAGTFIGQHSHKYDHATLLSAGRLRAWLDGELLGEFTAPHTFVIKAGTKHLFQALEDNTVFACIHRIDRTGEVEVLEEHRLIG